MSKKHALKLLVIVQVSILAILLVSIGLASPSQAETAPLTATPIPQVCQVTYTINLWGNGFTADVKITNISSSAISGWDLVWSFANGQQITGSWNAAVTQSGSAVTASNPASHWNGTIGANGGSVSFGFQATHTGTNAVPVQFTLNGIVCNGGTPPPTTPPPTLTPTIPTPTENLALDRPAFCSSIEHAGVPCEAAVDGNESTHWGSVFSDPQWIYVDLGANYNVSRVVLNWETAYGRWYEIQISADASSWSTVYTTYNGNGGIDDLTVSSFGRYVRMYGQARGTQLGYSLWEFQVYGSTGPTLPDLVITSVSTRYDPDVNCYTSQIPIAKPILGIDVAFVNASNADTGPFVVDYRNINTDATAQQSVSGLAAGQRGTLFFPDSISYTQGAWITLDSLNQVAEADENNNISGYQVPPEGTPLPTCTPTTTPTPTPTPTSPPPPAPCFYTYANQNDWGNGATIDVTIRNNLPIDTNGWTVTWNFPGDQQITNLWNGSYTQSGASVSVRDAGWNANIGASGGTVSFGFNITYSGSNTAPARVSLNGNACQVMPY